MADSLAREPQSTLGILAFRGFVEAGSGRSERSGWTNDVTSCGWLIASAAATATTAPTTARTCRRSAMALPSAAGARPESRGGGHDSPVGRVVKVETGCWLGASATVARQAARSVVKTPDEHPIATTCAVGVVVESDGVRAGGHRRTTPDRRWWRR